MPELKISKGWQYLQQTKLDRQEIYNMQRPEINPAKGTFKTYELSPKIPLPRQLPFEADNFWQVVGKRRSERDFSEKEINLDQLALMLWASQGLTANKGPYFLRNAPSAGALYPIETYISIQKVKDVKPGIYHFNPKDFSLEQISLGDKGPQIGAAAIDQDFCEQAAVNFIWSAIFRRNMLKYGHRGLRYIFLDAGHIAQNLLLSASAMNIKSCPVAAFFDEELNALIGLDGEEESVIYLTAVGK